MLCKMNRNADDADGADGADFFLRLCLFAALREMSEKISFQHRDTELGRHRGALRAIA